MRQRPVRPRGDTREGKIAVDVFCKTFHILTTRYQTMPSACYVTNAIALLTVSHIRTNSVQYLHRIVTRGAVRFGLPVTVRRCGRWLARRLVAAGRDII